MYDVIVIGGGPVGSHLAYRLAGMGYQVVVVEQKKKLGEPVCCTGIISRECVRSLFIDDDVILRWANGARFFSPSGQLLSLYRPEPQACIVDRAAFNVALARRAQDEGVAYVLNSQVTEVMVNRDRVRIEATTGQELNLLEARVVVLATGFGGKLMARLGLGKVGDFVMGAQAEVATNGAEEIEVYLGQAIAPAFFAWLVPTSSQKALVGLLTRHRPGFWLRKWLLSLLSQGKIASAEVKINYDGIPLKPLARTYADRLLVVGSAAGQVKPTTGGGIYYGLLCADIAADNLQRALNRGDLSARSLAGYERAWQRKLGQELKIGYWARQTYQRLSDRQIDQIFNIIKANGIDEALLQAEDLSFDWHGRAVLKLIGHRALSKVIGAMRLPFSRLGVGK